MDPLLINHLIKESFSIINNWNLRLHNEPEFNINGIPKYNLVVVGGIALNSYITKQLPTKDLDLKLVYSPLITEEEYFALYYNEFNPLRARIMIEIKNHLNRYATTHSEYFQHLSHNEKGEYFQVAIDYKRPYDTLSMLYVKIGTISL